MVEIVWVRENAEWWPAEVRDRSADGSVRVHFCGWGERHDTWIPATPEGESPRVRAEPPGRRGSSRRSESPREADRRANALQPTRRRHNALDWHQLPVEAASDSLCLLLAVAMRCALPDFDEVGSITTPTRNGQRLMPEVQVPELPPKVRPEEFHTVAAYHAATAAREAVMRERYLAKEKLRGRRRIDKRDRSGRDQRGRARLSHSPPARAERDFHQQLSPSASLLSLAG